MGMGPNTRSTVDQLTVCGLLNGMRHQNLEHLRVAGQGFDGSRAFTLSITLGDAGMTPHFDLEKAVAIHAEERAAKLKAEAEARTTEEKSADDTR